MLIIFVCSGADKGREMERKDFKLIRHIDNSQIKNVCVYKIRM